MAGDFLVEASFFSGDDSFAGVVAFTLFFGEAFFAGVVALEGEALFATLPVCTWSAAASCAFAEGTVLLGELLVVRSGVTALDFAVLAGDTLVGLAGKNLRTALAGVPSARDFAMAASVESIAVFLVEYETRSSKEIGECVESKQWERDNVLQAIKHRNAACIQIRHHHANDSKQATTTHCTAHFASIYASPACKITAYK